MSVYYTAVAVLISAALSMCTYAMADTPVFGVYEVSLTTTNNYTAPYTDVTVSAKFTGPTQTIEIEGFWDGGGQWKIRMAPTEAGTWTLTSVISNDAQLNHQAEGTTFTSTVPSAAEIAQNEVLRHGFITVNPAYPHTFMHADGTPFFFMGDTHWGGTSVLGTIFRDGTFQAVVDTRAQQGFTVFTVVHLALHLPNGNEGGSPFFSTYPSYDLNPAFFQWADKRIDYMTKKGIRPMLVLGARDSGLTANIDWLTRAQRYVIARYAAYDVIWFGVKEYQEFGSSSSTVANALGGEMVHDPYQHLSSMHPGGNQSTHDLGGQNWLSFNALQRGGALNGAPAQAGINLLQPDYANYNKPVVQSEAFYEEPSACTGPNNFTDVNVLVRGLWAIQLHGGWNAGYQLVAGCNNDLTAYLAKINNKHADIHTYLQKFFTEHTEYWKLKPHNRLLAETGWAAAQAGKEYVIFLVNGATATVDLSAATGTLNVEWYDPKTGLFSGASTATAGTGKTFTAASTRDWVLHIFGGNAANLPPQARFSFAAGPGLLVLFDASASLDSDGSVVSYDWDFGDGSIANDAGPTTRHTYTQQQSYHVILTVTDNHGATNSFGTDVFAGPPVLDTIEITPAALFIGASQPYTLSFQGLDQNGDPFPATVMWRTDGGGSINASTGEYVSGTTNGLFHITATSGNVAATIEVTVDSLPPSLQSISLQNASTLMLRFSEKLDTGSATETSHYTIVDDGGTAVAVLDTTNSTLLADQGRAQLVTANHMPGTGYTVTVSGIKDLAGNPMAAQSLNYTFEQASIISQLTVASGKAYEIAPLAVGGKVYIDRDFTFTTVPSVLAGLTAIRPANTDKTGGETEFLQFDLQQSANIYVAFDDRIDPIPDWLVDWQDTGEYLESTDTMSQLRVYKKFYNTGHIVFEGNNGGTYSMYILAFAPASPVLEPPGNNQSPGNTQPGNTQPPASTDLPNSDSTRKPAQSDEKSGALSAYLLLIAVLLLRLRAGNARSRRQFHGQ